MITTLETKAVGPLTLRLIEKPGIDPEFFAPRYYVMSQHADAPFFVAIEYAGHDRGHSERKYGRIVEHATAEAAEECFT